MIFLYIIYIIVCVGLVTLILIQPGQSGGLSGAFGGGGSETFFGSTSVQTIGYITMGVAAFFLVFSLFMANVQFERDTGSVVKPAPAAAGMVLPGPAGDPGDTSSGSDS